MAPPGVLRWAPGHHRQGEFTRNGPSLGALVDGPTARPCVPTSECHSLAVAKVPVFANAVLSDSEAPDWRGKDLGASESL